MNLKQKTGLCMTAFFVLVGCASAAPQPIIAAPETSSQDINAPTEEDIILADKEISRQEAVAKEEDAYDASLDKINSTFNAEYQQFRTCLVVSDKHNECFNQLVQMCKVDMILDSRAGRHPKPYCAQQFLSDVKSGKMQN
jgi:hypothetical protein